MQHWTSTTCCMGTVPMIVMTNLAAGTMSCPALIAGSNMTSQRQSCSTYHQAMSAPSLMTSCVELPSNSAGNSWQTKEEAIDSIDQSLELWDTWYVGWASQAAGRYTRLWKTWYQNPREHAGGQKSMRPPASWGSSKPCNRTNCRSYDSWARLGTTAPRSGGRIQGPGQSPAPSRPWQWSNACYATPKIWDTRSCTRTYWEWFNNRTEVRRRTHGRDSRA